VALRLFDSHSQSLREFTPLVTGQVAIYLCGPTVQSSPHVGHLRSALVYDQLRRWLTVKGNTVTLVRNVTDIDDKVLANAASLGEQWWALAYRYELEFNAAYNALRIAPPTYEPRATASIPEMLSIIERLIEAGYAYQATDGSADVYFAASKWADYGELTNQRGDDMASDEEADLRGKRDPRDFALWKAAKPGEPASASWATRFGAGRPGWHIECSAMATKYLGSQFDIHGGGLDLRFPHHENELAQSRAAGDAFANFWLHNGLVNVHGQKMSKSVGNSIFASDLLQAGRPLAVRFYLGSAHYRSVLDYHEGVLEESESALARIEGFLERAARRLADTQFAASQPEYGSDLLAVLPQEFIAAMDDDLSIPAALAALYEAIRTGNTELEREDLPAVASALSAVRGMVEVLGINPEAPQWASQGSGEGRALDALMTSLIEQRKAAREAKDFARADEIRDALQKAGIKLEDAADSTHWSL
jgi:cysteinyl-tRNA synthetase